MDADLFHHHYRLQPDLWRELVMRIARQEGLDAQSFHPFADGVNLVAAIDEQWVIKVFPHFLRHQWISETRVLRHLQGKLNRTVIPVLRSVGSSEEQWFYVVMQRVEGAVLERHWTQLEKSIKLQLMFQIGHIMAEVHSIPSQELADLPPQWESFLQEQIAGCCARHQSLGMPAWFTSALPQFLDEQIILPDRNAAKVILTGEYTPFNLLIDQHNPAQMSGMIDFADAMIGPPEYDLVGPMLFFAAGDGDLMSALLQGYGYKEFEPAWQLRRRLFTLQLLHRYSDFSQQLRVPDWQVRVHSLEQLESLIWPLADDAKGCE